MRDYYDGLNMGSLLIALHQLIALQSFISAFDCAQLAPLEWEPSQA